MEQCASFCHLPRVVLRGLPDYLRYFQCSAAYTVKELFADVVADRMAFGAGSLVLGCKWHHTTAYCRYLNLKENIYNLPVYSASMTHIWTGFAPVRGYRLAQSRCHPV
jgi:hypothetical protein